MRASNFRTLRMALPAKRLTSAPSNWASPCRTMGHAPKEGHSGLKRRQFISASLSMLLASPARSAEPLDDIPIIDTHVHLFDGRRPQGAPYRGSAQWAQESGGVALPSTYRPYANPLNIVGAIEVEASPWVEDNLWVL